MPRARVPTRVLGCVIALTVAAGAAAAEKPSARTPVATTQRSPEEFGTQDYTVTTIGYGSFTPASNDNSSYSPYTTFTDFGGLRENTPQGVDAHYYSTVSVPSGAVIDFVGLRGFNVNAGVTSVHLSLVDRFGFVTPIVGLSIPGSSFTPTTVYNASALGFQLAQNVHNLLVLDVENDDTADPFNAEGGFGWVEIWWKRTVSPPPASATFDDVPTSDPFFQYVKALAASGITAGCNQTPPQFCPDRALTRKEMAVFLSKGFGLHWPN